MLNNEYQNTTGQNPGLDNSGEESSHAVLNGKKQYTKTQKMLSAFLVFFGLAVIVIWTTQLYMNINEPLIKPVQNSANNASCPGGNCQSTDEAVLKTQDTDGDGLNDWEELYTYGTSPYIEDTDSDGYSDGEEVSSHNDPNCPRGQICNQPENSQEGNNEDANNKNKQQNNILNPTDNQTNPTDNQTNPIDKQGIIEGTSNPAYLRKVLIEAGMDKEILSKIKDEDLLKIYKETLSETK